jgi:hypothetical protein
MITNVITQVVGQQQPTAVTTIVKCDYPECPNSASFDASTQKQAIADTPWLRTYRTIQTADSRSFGYCGDHCELKGVASGQHNMPEPKKIIETGNDAAVAAAAQQAAAAKVSEQALREGTGGKIQITE